MPVSPELFHSLPMVAPGTALRDGLDRVLQARRGTLVVIGDGPGVLEISTGGFLLDTEFTPQRLSELAKMDGAIVLTKDAKRIARANVHLTPSSSVVTSETGTRHRTAERVARSLGVPVISVSHAMGVITLFLGDDRHSLRPTAALIDQADQALDTLQRFRSRFDGGLRSLNAAEVIDAATVGQVVEIAQSAETMLRINNLLGEIVVELGDRGRLVELQRAEIVGDLVAKLSSVIEDYAPLELGLIPRSEAIRSRLSAIALDEVGDPLIIAAAMGLSPEFESGVSPRGYRFLEQIPKLPREQLEALVEQFGTLSRLLSAEISDIAAIPGFGEAKARSVVASVARMSERAQFSGR
jgi:diadenylate cyclase